MQNFYVIIWCLRKYEYFVIIKHTYFKLFFAIALNEGFKIYNSHH